MPFLTFDQDRSAEVIRLLARAQEGDEVCLNQLLDRLRPKLVQYFEACRLAGDAEDLTQYALVSIARAVPRITPATTIGYVARLAQRLAYKAAQREHGLASRYAPMEEAKYLSVTSDTEARIEGAEARMIVIEACRTALTPEQQLVVFDVIAGYTPSDIAERWGIDAGTVRTRLLRARRVLHHILSERDN